VVRRSARRHASFQYPLVSASQWLARAAGDLRGILRYDSRSMTQFMKS
jgi:hypothetical protein